MKKGADNKHSPFANTEKTTDLKLKVMKDVKSNLLSDFLKSNEDEEAKIAPPTPKVAHSREPSSLSSDELFSKFVHGVGKLGQVENNQRDLKVLKSKNEEENEDKNLIRDYRIKLLAGDRGEKGIKGEMGDKGLRGDPAARGEKGLYEKIRHFVKNKL